jgi:hypothetical protein
VWERAACGTVQSINHEPMDKNRIEGVANQGERANYREALVVKERWRRCGACVMKECGPYLGTPSLVPERGDVCQWQTERESHRSGVSAEVIVVGGSAGKARPL